MAMANSQIAFTDEGYLPKTLMHAMHEGYLRHPFKQMVVGVGEGITYASAYRRALSLAGYMQSSAGITATSTVMVSASNIPEYPLIVAAVQLCGARLVLLPPSFAVGDVHYALTLTLPDLIFVSGSVHFAMMREAAPGVRIMTVGASDISAQEIEKVFSLGEDTFVFERFANNLEESEIVLFSSGSTGVPKAIVHNLSSFYRNAQALIETFFMTLHDTLFLPVPFAHVYGLLGIWAALFSGATIVTCLKYLPETALSLIADTRATLYFGVATMYLRELRANFEGDWDVSSLRAGLVAGSNCPEVVFSEYDQRYGCCLIQSYGMTETAATLTISSLDWSLEARARTVGKPASFAEVALVQESGEVLCKSSSMMLGALLPNGQCLLELDDAGWFHSGDVGMLDDAGRLRIIGRIKDMIIRGGINIYPAEVENVYQTNHCIAECCLVGYDDPDLGERACLCVVMKPGEWVSAHNLRSFAQGKVEKCKVPDVVLKMDDFPRLANGKIDKRSLRKIAQDALVPEQRHVKEAK